MRITFVSPAPNLSGGCRVIAIMADGLGARGHDVMVVASQPARPSRRSRIESLLKGRWPKAPSRRSHFDSMKTELRMTDHSGPVVDADLPDADVVIATWWETAYAVLHLSASKGRKFYYVQGHEVFDFLPVHLSAASYFLPLRKITIAGWLVETMRLRYGDDDVALVPNGVDRLIFTAPARGRQAVPTVGFMYSPDVIKGLDTTLEAVAALRRVQPDLRVVSFGSTPVARQHRLPPNASFHLRPEQAAIPGIYAECDAWIVGSRSEGFGLPILEAMACRCPVIATRTGCAADVIEDGVNGHVVEVGDSVAMAARLTDVLALPDPAWRAMSDAAHASTARYDWKTAAALFEAALLP